MLKELLEKTLVKYQTGEVRWNMANQFDETILEKAIANYTDEAVLEYLEGFTTDSEVHPMDLAHFLSDWEVPVLDRAWVD